MWLQKHTRTKDKHWREMLCPVCGSLPGAICQHKHPNRPFPVLPYFPPLVQAFQQYPVLFVEKSRDMMLSWLFVGLFTHQAMTIPGIEVLFQSQKEYKAFELVDYARTLWSQQDGELKKAYPIAKDIGGELTFANGSKVVGIPGGGDQIRSFHPWGILLDEAAHQPEAGESYDNAVLVCQKVVCLSSAGPGWFAEQCQSAE